VHCGNIFTVNSRMVVFTVNPQAGQRECPRACPAWGDVIADESPEALKRRGTTTLVAFGDRRSSLNPRTPIDGSERSQEEVHMVCGSGQVVVPASGQVDGSR
jgi:hypothetical protein